MRRLNRALDSQQRLRASAAIFSAVERLPEFRAARTVAVFAALSDEPATDEVLARWASTRRVVLPRVEGATRCGSMPVAPTRWSSGLSAFWSRRASGRVRPARSIWWSVRAWLSRPTAGGWGADGAIMTAISGIPFSGIPRRRLLCAPAGRRPARRTARRADGSGDNGVRIGWNSGLRPMKTIGLSGILLLDSISGRPATSLRSVR